MSNTSQLKVYDLQQAAKSAKMTLESLFFLFVITSLSKISRNLILLFESWHRPQDVSHSSSQIFLSPILFSPL
jgi:hypothetical protein